MHGEVLTAMIMCALFPIPEVPLGYREKVIITLIMMRFLDEYIKTENDIQWVNEKLKEMGEDTVDVVVCRTNST
jgi:hypothetical protein